MKLLRRIISASLFTLLFSLVAVLSQKIDAYAIGDGAYVIVSAYEVTNGEIIPGEEFDIGITIENVDQILSAEDVIVTIDTMTGINSIYPSVPQVYVGSIGPQEKKTVVFSYKLDAQYGLDIASFYVSIISSGNENSVVLSAPVVLDDSAFAILSKNVPTEGVVGEKISSSFYFRVRGEASLSNVLARVLVDGEEYVSSSIGNVLLGASKTQNITFSIGDIGKHNLVVEIEGVDQNGMLQVTEAYNGNIEITATEENRNSESDDVVVNMRPKRDYVVMGGAFAGIVLFVIGIVFVLRRTKTR